MRAAVAAILLALGAAPAGADPAATVEWASVPAMFGADVAAADVAPTIYLNRCAGGCTFTKGINDAGAHSSSIPSGPGPFNLTPFGHGDAVWNAVVACVRETFSPYGAIVTDVKPPAGTLYHEAVVAGTPDELGLPGWYGGVGVGTCTPVNNVSSFTFANVWSPNALQMCAVVAQESGHSWGLDHAFDCSDPMTYLQACGQQFFRNKQFRCGEGAARDCQCSGPFQNSHLRLLSVFGPGTPIPEPVVTLQVPQPNAQVTGGFAVWGNATAKRGFGHYELWLNGYRWARADGSVGVSQQTFMLTTAADVPDGIIDVELRVHDDLDQGYGSSTVTVTKGAPCASAATCATGQRCDAGRCMWDPPAGELGDACAYPQFCTTGQCQQDVCTRECFAGVSGDCPGGFTCSITDGSRGICLAGGPPGGDSICNASAGAAPGSLMFQLALVALALAGAARRRPSARTDRMTR